MKYFLTFAATISLLNLTGGAAIANSSAMSQEDFKSLTCGYIEEALASGEKLSTAIAEAYTVTKDISSAEQKSTLKKLLKSQISPKSFCSGH